MGKYEQLQRHLGQVDSDVRIQMTFQEVAQWVPGGLPPSAFRNPRWWANESNGSQAQALAWLKSGWAVSSVDLSTRTVTFERALSVTRDGVTSYAGVPAEPSAGAAASNGSSNASSNVSSNGSKNGVAPGATAKTEAEPAIAPTSVRAMEQLAGFLGGGRVAGLLHDLAGELDGADAGAASGAAAEAGFTPKLLSEAFAVRRHLGRLNDLIHAAAMTMALPQILEADEVVAQRPWLAADGDPAHAFDLETDRRVADFKLAVWTGKDATRKRALFQSLVHLAAQPAERRPELYVAGDAPLRFLRTSKSNAAWALNRGPESTKTLYQQQFGDLGLSIKDFVTGPAAHVRLVDISQVLPPVHTALSA